MKRDQAIGLLIFVLCIVVVISYFAVLFLYDPYIKPYVNLGPTSVVQFWLIALPVFVAFAAILLIGAWIGYTMARTPPPKPIEEPSDNESPDVKLSNETK